MNLGGKDPSKASMISRFEGVEGRKVLVEVLRTHAAILQHDIAIATKVVECVTLHELAPGDVLMGQDDADNDLYFVVSGSFRVFVNGREVAERGPGQHLGEMAIVDPSSRRTATVAASAPSVVAKMSGAAYLALANEHPEIWRTTALELCRRLDARKKFHRVPNETPRVFLGSSRESLTVAKALKTAIEDVAKARPLNLTVTIWCDGVFGACGPGYFVSSANHERWRYTSTWAPASAAPTSLRDDRGRSPAYERSDAAGPPTLASRGECRSPAATHAQA